MSTHILLDADDARDCRITADLDRNADGLTKMQAGYIKDLSDWYDEQGKIAELHRLFPVTCPFKEKSELWERTGKFAVPEPGQFYERDGDGKPLLCHGGTATDPPMAWMLRKIVDDS